MREDLLPTPELLPPLALLELTPPPRVMRAVMVGMGLLAMAGVWRAAPDPLAMFARPAAIPAVAHRSVAPNLIAMNAPAVGVTEVAAGQPAVLSAPAGGGGSADSSALAGGETRASQ